MGATQSTEHPHTLATPIGTFKGTEQRDKSTGQPIFRTYFRIPYAQPPVGCLRWRRPQPLPAGYRYNGDNTAFGPICPQPKYEIDACRIDNPTAAPEPELTQSEDCLYLNIWVPSSTPPPEGWPVQYHIHGGWLQIGDANQGNEYDPFDLFKDTTPRIIVAATYRLNVFGFLAGQPLADAGEEETVGNYGFWDQRLALEWVYKNISHFNGNPQQITMGGLSAGANSTFFQLFYDSNLPEEARIIKRVYLWSNSVAIQPNSSISPALTDQFHELCAVNDISPSLSARDKLTALRAIPFEKLISSITLLKMHTFRGSTDDSFIPRDLLSSLHSGTFTTLLAKHDIGIMLGEVCDEKNLYAMINPPDNYDSMITQLRNYYPAAVCDRLVSLYGAPEKGSGKASDFVDVFSRIVADMQVHCSLRGFTRLLLSPPKGPGVEPVLSRNLHRYRICWRARSLDEWIIPEVGVTHAMDGPIWWGSGWRMGFTEQDKRKAVEFLKPFGEFLSGSEVSWGRRKGASEVGDRDAEEKRVRVMDSDGVTREDVDDELWDWGMEVWDAVWEVQKGVGVSV
ncbi:hypothetical protein DV737_g823, partial [Chaetothyriales sp. CBS 132003]